MKNIIVVGASNGIGNNLINKLLDAWMTDQVIKVDGGKSSLL
tara:strand:+ start:225 stop:350 length:126 start_codon:yes stop_codon:yes gene_type:complete